MADEEAAGNNGGLNVPVVSPLNELHQQNMKDRLEDEKYRHENSLRKIEEFKHQIDELKEERALKEEKICELETTGADTREKLHAEMRRNEENEHRLMELQNQIVLKDNLLEAKESVVKESEKKIQGLEKQLEWLVENNKVLTNGLQDSQRKVEELKQKFDETNTNKESERYLKDEYVIRCDMLAKKLELTESESVEMDKCVEITVKNLEEEREKVDLCEKEIDLLTEELQSEKNKNTDNQVLIQDMQEQMHYFQALNEYNDGVKSSSIENIMEAEQENERLQDHIADLMDMLGKKDSAIEELVAKNAMGEQVCKEESDKNKQLMDRLRAEVQELRLREIDCERIREKESELSQVKHKLKNEREKCRHLEEQIARLEDLTKLEDQGDWRVRHDKDSERTGDRIDIMKAEYQKKKLEQKDEEIQRLAKEIDELYEKLKDEQRQVGDRDIVTVELNAANRRDLSTIEKLALEVQMARQQAEAEKRHTEQMTDKVEEGQRLITELEKMADRERTRAVAMEEVLSSEKGKYTQQMDVVKDLKKKVEEYQRTVGEVRTKVDRMNRHMHCGSSHDGPRPAGDANVRKLNEKLSEQKTLMRELRANICAVEERNESLTGQIQEQKGKNIEQDTKLQQLLGKSSDNEDLMTDMKIQLEDMKTRYQGLSWELQAEEEDEETSIEDLTSPPPQSPRTLAKYVRNIPEQALSKQLTRFENLFENIFCEEAKRMEELQINLQGVINKNTELTELLVQIKDSVEDEEKKKSAHRTEVDELESKLRRSEVQIDNLISAIEKEGNITLELNEEIRNLREQKDEKEDAIRDLRDEMRTAKEIEKKVKELNEELESREKLVQELQVDLEMERKCYKIVSERLQSEQNKNCELENKVSELEILISGDKETFEEIRYQADSESSKRKKLLEEMDTQLARAVELEEKIKELEEHISRDLELFDEMRAIIEQEKEQSRKLDSMLQDEKQRISSNLDQGNKASLDLEERLLDEIKRSGQLQATTRQHQDHNYELEKMIMQLQRVVQETEKGVSSSNKDLEDEKKRNTELCERVSELQGKVLKGKEQTKYLIDEGEKDFQAKHHDTQKHNEELKKQLDDLKKDFDVIKDNKKMDVSAKLQEAVRETQKRLKKATAVLAAKENVIQKTRQEYDKRLAEKEVQLRKREKSLVVLKKALEGLRSEKEREEASKKARGIKESGGDRQKFEDASEIIKDLEMKVQKLKEEVQSKTELAKDMKEDITELRSSKHVDAKLLKRKENLHRVVTSEMEESEKKGKRLKKLHDLLVEIIRADDKKDTEDSSNISPGEQQTVNSKLVSVQKPIKPFSVAETFPGRLPTVVEEVLLPEQSIVVESVAPMREESSLHVYEDSLGDNRVSEGGPAGVYKSILLKESTPLECCNVDFDNDQFIGEFGFDEFDKDLFKYVDSLKDEGSDNGAKMSSDRDADSEDGVGKDDVDGGMESQLPNDRDLKDVKIDSRRPALLDWRMALGGIVLTVFMLLLQLVLPQKASTILSALLFMPIIILVSRYERKRLQKETKRRAVFIGGDNQDMQRVLVAEQEKLEELILLTDGDAQVIQELRSQLEEELAEKEGVKQQLAEVKTDKESLLLQERTIEDISGRMRQLEKATIDGAEKQTQGFEEYKMLREEIDKLRQGREREMKKEEAKIIELGKIPFVGKTKMGWSTIKKVNLPIASLPLWIGVAVLLYHLSALHVVAPYAIFCSLMLVSANAWYTVKRWSKVLEEERRISAEQNEELEEVTELLDREYDVVKAQKYAIDMLVKEIEEEQASRKAKQVALAKLIWQLQEMEGMQTLVLKERRHQTGMKDWQSTVRQVAQEKATEKANTYSSIISQLKDIGAADTAEEDDMTDDLCEAAKELTKYAEEQIEEVNKLHVENVKQDATRTKKLSLSWKTIAMVTINTVTLGAALIFKSYIAAAVFAAQAVLYALQRKRTAARLGSVKDDVNQKLLQEIERNKAQQAENEKLKKLLRTAGRYKRSDEFAMEVKERCRKRAQQRQL